MKNDNPIYIFKVTENDIDKFETLTEKNIGMTALVIRGEISVVGKEEKVNILYEQIKRSVTR